MLDFGRAARYSSLVSRMRDAIEEEMNVNAELTPALEAAPVPVSVHRHGWAITTTHHLGRPRRAGFLQIMRPRRPLVTTTWTCTACGEVRERTGKRRTARAAPAPRATAT